MDTNKIIFIIGEIIKYLNPKMLDSNFRSREICSSDDVLEIVYEYQDHLLVFTYIVSMDFKNEIACMSSYLNPRINTNRRDISFNDLFGNDEKNKNDFIEIVNNIGSDDYDLSQNDLYIKYKLEADI